MTTLGDIYHDIFELPLEKLAEEVTLDGLTKLNPPESGLVYSSMFLTPDRGKMSIGQWTEYVAKKMDEWHEPNNGPYPQDLFMSFVKMPRILMGYSSIKRAYTPISFSLPVGTNETYGELKSRIEEGSMRIIQKLDKELEQINAFYLGNLKHNYELSDNLKLMIPVMGDSFLDKPARKYFIPRIAFDLCLFEIEKLGGKKE